MVSGCATAALIAIPQKPEKTFKTIPLPYRFQITSFADNRPPATSIAQDTDFNQPAFLSEFSQSLGFQLFGSSPAIIKISLEEYSFSSFKQDYTMSIAFKIKSKSNLGKVLVDEDFSCIADHHGSVRDVADMALGLKENLEIVTRDGWKEKIELDLIKKCVRNVINDFSKAVVRGTPAQGDF